MYSENAILLWTKTFFILTIAVPLFPLIVGGAVSTLIPRCRDDWAICALSGLLTTGFLGEIVYFSGIPRLPSFFVLFSGCLVLIHQGGQWKTCVKNFCRLTCFYLPFLAFLSLVPLPGMFGWWGDWKGTLYQAFILLGEEIPWQTCALLSSRPPLNGFALSPLVGIGPSFIMLQASSALVGATMVGMCVLLIESFVCRKLSLIWKYSIVFSPVALLHVNAMWSKPLAAACLLCFVYFLNQAHREKGVYATWTAATFFAFAVATHESSIIYGFLLPAWFSTRNVSIKSILGSYLSPMLFAGLLIVGFYRLMIVLDCGWGFSVSNNPALSYRASEESLLMLTLINLASTFTGYGFGFFKSAAVLLPEILSKWGNASWQTLYLYNFHIIPRLGGSLVFVILPLFLFTKDFFKSSHPKITIWILSLGCVILVHSILSPYPSHTGIAQNGLLPLQLLIMIAVISRLQDSPKMKKTLVQLYFGFSGILVIGFTYITNRQFYQDGGEPPSSLFIDSAYPDASFFHQTQLANLWSFWNLAGIFFCVFITIVLWRLKLEGKNC